MALQKATPTPVAAAVAAAMPWTFVSAQADTQKAIDAVVANRGATASVLRGAAASVLAWAGAVQKMDALVAIGKERQKDKDAEKGEVVPKEKKWIGLYPPANAPFVGEFKTLKAAVVAPAGYKLVEPKNPLHLTAFYGFKSAKHYDAAEKMRDATPLDWKSCVIKRFIRTATPLKNADNPKRNTYAVFADVEFPQANELHEKMVHEFPTDQLNHFDDPTVPGSPKRFSPHFTAWFLEALADDTPPLSTASADLVMGHVAASGK